jgi:hypothetical protein
LIARDEPKAGNLDRNQSELAVTTITGAVSPSNRRRHRWKLTSIILALAVLATAGLLGSGLLSGIGGGNKPAVSVPTQMAGERVYRAIDQSSFTSLKGSFLLGGLVTYPDVVPPCPSEAGPPGDGHGLIPYCYWPSIDGLALSPKGTFDEPGDETVVVRVHVNDPLAAGCRPAVRAECDAAIVVESVLWRSKTK